MIQTGCSADNVTVLTTPPFSFCFNLEMARMWECLSSRYMHSRRQAEAGIHVAGTVKIMILTHTDVPTETLLCVHNST